MSECLQLKKSNCKNCYKCVRFCPVKSIKFVDDQANIVSDDCILCGHCFIACPQNAKEIRNDIPIAKELIAQNAQVFASLAPSFRANYDDVTISSMEKVLKKLGFAGVEETAIGATIIKTKYDEQVAARDVTISSCCHTINLLIQRYFPEALSNLSPLVSPMQAHSIDIKRRCPDAKTVFIGPCISKKAEAESYPGIVDCVLTFEELTLWLQDEGATLEYIHDENSESRARFFPTVGGILKTMVQDNPEYTYLAFDGIESCICAIKDIISGKLDKCFVEMSACARSCIGGPAIDKNHHSVVRDYIDISRYAGHSDFPVESYDDELLKKVIPSLAPRQIYVDESSITEILEKIGKTEPEHELNCGCCGYNTCRDKARAVLDGKANLNMCLPFLSEKAKSFSDSIITNTPNAAIVLNESLELQQINASACKLMNIRNEKDVLGSHVVRILDPQPFMRAFETKHNTFDKQVYLPEYQKYVEQSIIFDKTSKIVICIMRDITEEVARLEDKIAYSQTAIELANKVIEKQMRSVQEIASLLGETTAETKVALTKLKESLGNE